MAEMEQARELLAQIKIAWDKAEQAIKRSELVCGEVVTPAIKELRYAGRRLADGLEAIASGQVTAETNGFLRDALFDCYRARHDAIDAAISKIAVEIDLAVKRLGYDNTIQSFPALPKLLRDLTDAKTIIADSRGNRTERDKIYATLEEVNLRDLAAAFDEFRHAEPFIRQLAARDRRVRAVTYISGAVALLALFVALAAWLAPRPAVTPAVSPSEVPANSAKQEG